MTPDEWKHAIQNAARRRPTAVKMMTFIRRHGSDSKPAFLRDSDGNEYVVKALIDSIGHLHRVLVNDQIVARIGTLLKMPVGKPVLARVTQDLIDREPELQGPDAFKPGIAHATYVVPGCADRKDFGINAASNLERYAALAVLYGLCKVDRDHQVLSETAPPHRVYSVDHGHFFPSGPTWTAASLAAEPAAIPDAKVKGDCGLTDALIDKALPALKNLTDQHIARIVSIPPNTWNFPIDDRVALCEYLASRRDCLLNS